MKQLSFKNSQEWRAWLQKNHDKEAEVWLVYFKKESGEQSIDYESSVEEALCFGWIDSIIKNLDETRYARKFNPRKAESKWSELNKQRVEKLIKSKRMTKFGLAKIEAAEKNGMWDKSDRPKISLEIPKEFDEALRKSKKAGEFFAQLAPSYQKQYIVWIAVAKRPETRKRRIEESIALLAKREKLGLR
jgi:uncharacterized protein YdeI (YjbR/CyaY-like superfamily)